MMLSAALAATYTLTLSVFGNGDGEIGRRFANGEMYRRGSRAFACNLFPLNATLEATLPNGKKIVAPNKDRISKRFSRSRIDGTLAIWKEATSRGYGLMRGVRVRQLAPPPKKRKR